MKPKSSIDRFALKRDKEMTPHARLTWLAAAWEFMKDIQIQEKKNPKQKSSP
jgi:hypothetical protein